MGLAEPGGAAEMRGRAQPLVAEDLWLAAEPSELEVARDYARRVASSFGFEDDDCYDLVYAVNEAVTNAIRHGCPDERGLICLSVASDAERLSFSIRDTGRFVIPAREENTTMPSRGRGFALMATLVDEVHVRFESSGTTVTLSKSCTTLSPD